MFESGEKAVIVSEKPYHPFSSGTRVEVLDEVEQVVWLETLYGGGILIQKKFLDTYPEEERVSAAEVKTCYTVESSTRTAIVQEEDLREHDAMDDYEDMYCEACGGNRVSLLRDIIFLDSILTLYPIHKRT